MPDRPTPIPGASRPRADSQASELLDELRQIKPHDHLASIRETREEQVAAAVSAILIGIESGEKCIYVAGDELVEDFSQALRGEGMDVESALASGILWVATRQETFLRQGRFDPDDMIRFWGEAARAATSAGFSGLRVVAEMTWALGGDPGTERLIEYESKLNAFVCDHPVMFICQYNRRRFAPEVLLDVIRTHPIVLSAGLVCRNPYYVPLEEFYAALPAEKEVERLLNSIRDHERTDKTLADYGKTREARFRREQEFEALVENSPDVVSRFDRQFRHLYINRVAERVTGLPASAFIGKTHEELGMPRHLQAAWRAVLENVFESGEEGETEFEFQTPSGTRYYHSRLVPEHAADGSIRSVLNIARDITARKHAEDSLRQSQSQFRALTKHVETLREEDRTRISREIHDELGQSLTALKMDLRWLERRLEGTDLPAAAMLERIVAAGELADSIIASVQSIAAELRPGVLDKLGLASALEYESRRFQERTGTFCEVETSAELPLLTDVVATALFRVLQECLANIARHANATRVRIGLTASAMEIRLTVEDNGRGITAAEIAAPGSLGLLGMKERIAALDGDIVVGRHENPGTLVIVQVPVVSERKEEGDDAGADR
ncbi:MAG: MEDS domain-containing protein [Luteolibacter sp.]